MFQTGHFHLATLRKDSVEIHDPHSSTTRSGLSYPAALPTDTGARPNHQPPHNGLTQDFIQRVPFAAQNTAVAESITPTDQWDGESQSSQAHIIKQTRGFEVDYEDV